MDAPKSSIIQPNELMCTDIHGGGQIKNFQREYFRAGLWLKALGTSYGEKQARGLL